MGWTTRHTLLACIASTWLFAAAAGCQGTEEQSADTGENQRAEGWSMEDEPKLDGGEGHPDEGWELDEDTDTLDGGPYVCDAVAIPCCNDQGEYVENMVCTRDGLKCRTGLHHDDQCGFSGPETGTDATDTTDTRPSCDLLLIRCCDESGQFVTAANCTHDGLKCPAGTGSRNCNDAGLDATGSPDTPDT